MSPAFTALGPASLHVALFEVIRADLQAVHRIARAGILLDDVVLDADLLRDLDYPVEVDVALTDLGDELGLSHAQVLKVQDVDPTG